MNNIIGGFIRSKTALASLLVLVGVVGVSALANSWGPDRPTFTVEKPATYNTFNSITNSPYGDERNFVRIKEVGQPNSAYVNDIKLVPGKEYQVYTFFHNNAAANLNLVAKNTKLKVFIPNEIKAGQKVRIDSSISSSNTRPARVYDEVMVSTDSDIALRYVPGSAVLNTVRVKNIALPFDQMIKDGTLIGSFGRDGKVPGCAQFSGHVLYRFQVVQPNFTVQKEVRKLGTKNWSAELKDVKAGETLEYRVTYTNTGSITQNNVNFKDALPKGLTYVNGSAEFKNARTKNYLRLTADADAYFKKSGWFKAGNYAPNSNVYLRYQLKVEDVSQMNCGYNNYTNIVSAVTENGTKQARAKVTAHKRCEAPKPKQIQVCELNTKQIINIKETDFNTSKHSKNLSDCQVAPQPIQLQVCDLSTKTIITIKQADFNNNRHSKNLSDCQAQPKNIQVCELATKQIVTIKETDFNGTKHSKKLDDCKTVPTQPEQPGKVDELPKTGLDALTSLVGLTSLIASASYYINSRRLA